MAYATLAEGRDDSALEQLDIALGMTDNPQEEALAELRRHQEATGLKLVNPDEPVPPAPGGDEEFGWP